MREDFHRHPFLKNALFSRISHQSATRTCAEQRLGTTLDAYYTLWKTLYGGSSSDRKLLKAVARFPRLVSYIDREASGRGFQVLNARTPALKLRDLEQVCVDSFTLGIDALTFTASPSAVDRLGKLKAYRGPRLLVQRGIDESSEDKGRITARYETEPFCFNKSLYGLKLQTEDSASLNAD